MDEKAGADRKGKESTPLKLIMTKNVYDFLNSVKSKGKEEERCGLLGGRKKENFFADEIFEIKNVKASVSEFELDPAESLKVFEYAERKEKEVIGVWHTHPFWKAYPSAKDLAGMKLFPGVWVIVSRDEMKAFVLEDDINEIEIVVKF